MTTTIPIHTLSLPEYSIAARPDYATIGPKLDRFIAACFPAARLALRGLFTGDHPDLTRDGLIAVIQRLGTDRYDPTRKGMHHDWYADMGVEIHAVDCTVANNTLQALTDEDYIGAPSFMGEFMADFYESALAERGYSLRLDIILAYDLAQLDALPEGFKFKNPARKPEALSGIVNVLDT